MAYIKIEEAIAEIDKGDLLVGNNAEWAKEVIRRTPTADVVEVVRCKDCEDFTKAMIGGDLEFLCKNAKGMINPAPDKYCSYGTPKERGGEK